MNKYITRINGWGHDDTAQFAQVQSLKIAQGLGFRDMAIYGFREFGEREELLSVRLDGIISGVNRGDVVVFQFPSWNGLRYDEHLTDKLNAYRCDIIFFIHDLGALMVDYRVDELDRTVAMLNKGKVIIAASEQLKEYLISKGVRADIPFVIQHIWDYTTDMQFVRKPKYKKSIAFAGDPDKFTFAHEWNYDVPLELYSDRNCRGGNVIKKGWREQQLLLMELSAGGFGLVWHAHEMWRNYMHYNNTMKLSAYLAAGIPAIVPKGISNQQLLEKNHLAIVVESLEEAADKVSRMSEAEYDEYVRHTTRFAELLRDGYFTRKVLIDAMHALVREDL